MLHFFLFAGNSEIFDYEKKWGMLYNLYYPFSVSNIKEVLYLLSDEYAWLSSIGPNDYFMKDIKG